MGAPQRRTQAERRESTIARLLDATIELLAESGYSQMTVAAVCKRAEMSQGALFRHFKSRAELIAAATEEVCRRHLELVAVELGGMTNDASIDPLRLLVRSLRQAARTAEHAAWHEVMVAARTNADLHARVAPTLQRFEQALLEAISELESGNTEPGHVGMVVLSVMHLLDSEAVTVAVYPNPALEARREDWLVDLLRRELS